MCADCWVGTEARGSKGRREWGCVQEGVMTDVEGVGRRVDGWGRGSDKEGEEEGQSVSSCCDMRKL